MKMNNATLHAVWFAEQLLTAPANVLSSLAVEGYKKWMLVSLIMDGNVATIPKYAPNAVTRHLKAHTVAYETLVTCCQVRTRYIVYNG